MKNLVIILSLITAVFTNAQAESVPALTGTDKVAYLDTFEVEHAHLQGVNTGSVTVKPKEGVIVLQLTEIIVCPLGHFCAAVEHVVNTITLPIQLDYQDRCGSTIYYAELDLRAVHGDFRSLRVSDHSTMTCEIALNYYSDVEYATISGRDGVLSRSFFHGGLFGSTVVIPDFPSMPPVLPLPFEQ